MNAFYEHHKHRIQFGYRCFDRLLLNGVMQPFQQPERVLGFFNAYRDGRRVTRRTLTEIADQYGYGVRNRSEKWGTPIVDAPQQQRRDDFVRPSLPSSPMANVAKPSVNTGCSSPKPSTATIRSSSGEPPWTNSVSGCWT
jgi:hypothetical protein